MRELFREMKEALEATLAENQKLAQHQKILRSSVSCLQTKAETSQKELECCIKVQQKIQLECSKKVFEIGILDCCAI